MVYRTGLNKDVEDTLMRVTKKCEGEGIIIGGDFNTRIGELGNIDIMGNECIRKSKDKVIGNGGRKFIDMIHEKGWYILNGSTEGNWEGEFTYVGARGSTVIDYAVVNEYVNDKIVKFEISERVDSDHMPLSLVLEKEEEEEEEEKEEKSQEEWKRVICWDEEARKLYKANTEEGEEGEKGWIQGEEITERKWEKIKETIQAALVIKKVKQRRRKIGHKDWWDKSCTKRKREVKRKYRRWKKGLGAKEDYLEEKRNLKEWVEKKKKTKREEEEEVLRKLKNEKEVWKFINRKRIKKERRENNITKEEWRRHFMEVLGGSENQIEEEGRKEEEREEAGKEEKSKEEELVEEEEVEEQEIVEAVRKIKIGKAAGIDGIPY